MSNLRQLKKQVRLVCEDLASECLIAQSLFKGVDRDAMNKVIDAVASLQENALRNASFRFDKTEADFPDRAAFRKARSEYFRKGYTAFWTHFSDHVQEIVKQMNAALPKEVKDANVKASDAPQQPAEAAK